MRGKSVLVFFILFFVGMSLFSYDLKKEFVDIHKKILADQKDFFELSKKMDEKYYEDTIYINEGFEMMRDSLWRYISLLNLYNRIKPECKESKRSGREYLKNTFHQDAESKKQIAVFMLKHQSNFNKAELIKYSGKCIEYNTQISFLLKDFK